MSLLRSASPSEQYDPRNHLHVNIDLLGPGMHKWRRALSQMSRITPEELSYARNWAQMTRQWGESRKLRQQRDQGTLSPEQYKLQKKKVEQTIRTLEANRELITFLAAMPRNAVLFSDVPGLTREIVRLRQFVLKDRDLILAQTLSEKGKDILREAESSISRSKQMGVRDPRFVRAGLPRIGEGPANQELDPFGARQELIRRLQRGERNFNETERKASLIVQQSAYLEGFLIHAVIPSMLRRPKDPGSRRLMIDAGHRYERWKEGMAETYQDLRRARLELMAERNNIRKTISYYDTLIRSKKLLKEVGATREEVQIRKMVGFQELQRIDERIGHHLQTMARFTIQVTGSAKNLGHIIAKGHREIVQEAKQKGSPIVQQARMVESMARKGLQGDMTAKRFVREVSLARLPLWQLEKLYHNTFFPHIEVKNGQIVQAHLPEAHMTGALIRDLDRYYRSPAVQAALREYHRHEDWLDRQREAHTPFHGNQETTPDRSRFSRQKMTAPPPWGIDPKTLTPEQRERLRSEGSRVYRPKGRPQRPSATEGHWTGREDFTNPRIEEERLRDRLADEAADIRRSMFGGRDPKTSKALPPEMRRHHMVAKHLRYWDPVQQEWYSFKDLESETGEKIPYTGPWKYTLGVMERIGRAKGPTAVRAEIMKLLHYFRRQGPQGYRPWIRQPGDFGPGFKDENLPSLDEQPLVKYALEEAYRRLVVLGDPGATHLEAYRDLAEKSPGKIKFDHPDLQKLIAGSVPAWVIWWEREKASMLADPLEFMDVLDKEGWKAVGTAGLGKIANDPRFWVRDVDPHETVHYWEDLRDVATEGGRVRVGMGEKGEMARRRPGLYEEWYSDEAYSAMPMTEEHLGETYAGYTGAEVREMTRTFGRRFGRKTNLEGEAFFQGRLEGSGIGFHNFPGGGTGFTHRGGDEALERFRRGE